MRILLGILVIAALLQADGGAVLQRQNKAPYAITVFDDLSILLQQSETLEPVLDAGVTVELTKGDRRIEAQATRTGAHNKLLYTAALRPDEPGDWTYTIEIHSPRGPASVTGQITQNAQQPATFLLLLPFLCLTILALNQILRRTHPMQVIR